MYKNINKLINFFIEKSEFLFSWGALVFALYAIFRCIQLSDYISVFFGFVLLLCMLIYFFVKNQNIPHIENSHYSKKIGKINNIIFITLYILSTISLYFHSTSYERPIIFYIFYICMISSVLIQILLRDDGYLIILCKIIFLVVFYILTQALLFKSLMSIDSFEHMSITNTILNNGVITQFSPGYTFLFHLLHAESQLISGFDYNYSNLLVVLPAIMICTVLTIFLIGRNLITPQVGLLASLILICLTYFLYFSINLIPNSYSSIFLVFALFSLLKIYDSKNYISYTALLLLFITFTAMTHVLTDLVLLIILLSYIFFINLRDENNPNIKKMGFLLIGFSIIIFIALAIYIYILFSFSVSYFVSGMQIYELRASNELQRIIPIVHYIRPMIEVFHEKISLFTFWIISIPGCLYLIQKSNKNIKTLAFTFATLSFFAFFFYIIVSGREIINIRMYYLISFFVCIFSSIFIILIYTFAKKNYIKVAVIGLTLSLCIVCTISPPSNITNPLYSSLAGPLVYPSESELSMLSSLRTIDPKPLASDSTIVTTERFSGRTDISSIDPSIVYLEFFYNRDNTIIISDSIFKLTPGKEILFPEKEVITYSLATNKFSKMFDIGRARSYIYL